jgi:uncharacterized membrane protein
LRGENASEEDWMLGFVIGTACLVGLIKVLRGGRCGGRYGFRGHRHGCGGGGGCGHGGGGGWHHGRWDARDDDGEGASWGGGGGGPIYLRAIYERLGTTPGQERVIQDALSELKAAAKKIKDERRQTVKDVADAVRGEDFSTEKMGDAFARVDGAVETMRTAAFSALAKVHDALDEEQRKKLADLISRAGGPSRFANDLF